MKNILKTIIISFLFLAFAPIAQAKFRDVDSSGFENIDDIKTEEVEFASGVSTVETVNAIKDNNEKLYGIVGKSQVLSFDQDIERVSITDNSVADIVVLSPKQLLVNGKKAGATSMIFWSQNSTKPVFYNLVIQQNTDSFIQAVEHVAPNENVSIIFNDTGAVLTGQISSSAVKEKILNLAKAYNIKITDLTESPTKQVLLEVKITEASKNFARDLGVEMKQTGNFDLHGLGSAKYNTSTGASGISFQYLKPNLDITIKASEEKGDIKILAEPKLLAINGEEGSFTVGNQVPVPSEMGQYGNISYEYKDSGVVLKFTPTIMEESNRVRLKLQPEISEIDSAYSSSTSTGATVYGFKTRKVQTTVELMDGETLVIAGLLQTSSSKSKKQVPILGNIPVLGALFSSISDDKDDTEVIIFITPRIVDNSVNIDNL